MVPNAPAEERDSTARDTLWATDATEGWTEEGRCAVFVMIDYASGEAWAGAGLRMDRFAAADLLREVSAERFGSVDAAVASGLALRYDGGPCFRSEHYQVEIDHLGTARSPAYHYEPETNGCAEKFIQTLKEQVLWIERFASFEALRAAVRRFALTYNREWLLERHQTTFKAFGCRRVPATLNEVNETPQAAITLTDKAAEKIGELLGGQDGAEDQALRVAVRGGGCSGFQYALAFDRAKDDDNVFEVDGVSVVVDKVSTQFVFGSEVDYVEGLQGAGFQVNNPNVVAACGCGSSFQVKEEAAETAAV